MPTKKVVIKPNIAIGWSYIKNTGQSEYSTLYSDISISAEYEAVITIQRKIRAINTFVNYYSRGLLCPIQMLLVVSDNNCG